MKIDCLLNWDRGNSKKKKKNEWKNRRDLWRAFADFFKNKKTQNLKRTESGVSHTLIGMDFFLDSGWVPHQTGRI